MRFAVISDIQGNLDALEAALSSIDRLDRPVDRIISSGDVVGLGPQPNEVIDRLREREIEAIRGNYDDAVAFERLGSGMDFPDAAMEEVDQLALEWTREKLTPQNLAYLQNLPRDLRLFPSLSGTRVKREHEDTRTSEYRRNFFMRALFGGLARENPRPPKSVLVVHGSTRALNEFLRPDTANSILAIIAREARSEVLISAHAGMSYKREASGVTFVGVGPAAGPSATPGQAQFAVVDVGSGVDVQFDRAAYDAERYAEALGESGLPGALAIGYRQSTL